KRRQCTANQQSSVVLSRRSQPDISWNNVHPGRTGARRFGKKTQGFTRQRTPAAAVVGRCCYSQAWLASHTIPRRPRIQKNQQYVQGSRFRCAERWNCRVLNLVGDKQQWRKAV